MSVHRMKPKHLELIVKIAETQKLQIAADHIGISQPAASRILQTLEAEFDVTLFERHPTGMEPTAAGQTFIRHARSALTELDTLAVEIGHLKSGQIGTVRVGAVTGPAVGQLMPAVHAIQTTSPDVHISVDVAPSLILFRGLEEARYDFILGRPDPNRESREFLFHPGRKEDVRLMVHASHPLAGRRSVDLADLRSYPWVIQEEGSPIRQAVESAFHAQGLPVPPKVLNSSSLLVAFALIEKGGTIAPQTEEVVRLFTSDQMGTRVAVLNTNCAFEVPPYFLIQHKRRKLSRAAEGLLRKVLEHF